MRYNPEHRGGPTVLQGAGTGAPYLPVAEPQPLLRHREARLRQDALLDVAHGPGRPDGHGPAAHAAGEDGHPEPPVQKAKGPSVGATWGPSRAGSRGGGGGGRGASRPWARPGPGGVTCPPSRASRPSAGPRPPQRAAPAHGRLRRPERPGAGAERGILMAQAGAAPARLSRISGSGGTSRAGNARGSGGRGGGAGRGRRRRRRRRAPGRRGPRRRRPRARARPPVPLAAWAPRPARRPRPAARRPRPAARVRRGAKARGLETLNSPRGALAEKARAFSPAGFNRAVRGATRHSWGLRLRRL